MADSLRLGLLGVALVLILVVMLILRRGRIPIKYALIWLIPPTILLLLVMVPSVFLCFANLLGFETISNLVVGLLFVMLFFVIMALTVIIAGQTTKINLLIQEVSSLKKKINDKK